MSLTPAPAEEAAASQSQALAEANRALQSEIEEHRVAREQLLQRTAELEGLIGALPDVYLRTDSAGVVNDFRFGAEAAMYPIPDEFPPDLLGRDPRTYLPQPARDLWESAFLEVCRNGRVVRTEYPLLVAGQERYFEVRIGPVSDGGTIAVIRDITEQKRNQAALAEAKETAERANRAKSEFLSRMSHELRTPLNSILGFSQVLERGELSARQAKQVQHILKAGRHLLRLINEVLEIARIEAGRHNLSLEPVNMGSVLQEAIALIRPLASEHAVHLPELSRDCDTVYVKADRHRLVQVMLNLLSNAIKYNRPSGRVWITCARTEQPGEAPSRFSIRVHDTGPGVAAERAGELFTPFARLGAEQTPVEGTGLGLALSQRLIEAMGGALSLESSAPLGSVFRIDLTLADSPLQRLEESPSQHAAWSDAPPHASATLLYIEDNLANLSLLETILEVRPNWRLVPALQGRIGIELAREHAPDLILLDLHLPDMNGIEVFRRLRRDLRTVHIPVVVISADATSSTVERLLAEGVAAFLTKPLDVDEFLHVLDRLLGGRAAS